MEIDVEKALAHGLQIRPLGETLGSRSTPPRAKRKTEHGGWRIGVLFEGRWLDFSDLDTQLTPTQGLPMPPEPEDDEPPIERIVPWDPEE